MQSWGRRPLGGGSPVDRDRLVRQLEASHAMLAAHPLVRAAAGELASELLAGAPIDAASLDRVVDPRTSHVVVDADADQLAVLADLKQGRRLLVVLAPPGTGKSQTIANLLAGEIARGSRTLFVSAKPAALEVVRRRLATAGLAQYCAELREGEIVFGSRDRPQPLPSMREEEHARLERVRAALDDYARQLHEIHWPLERSMAGVLGELAGLHAAPQLVWTPAAADLLMPEQLEELRELAARLSRVWGVAIDEGCPWRHLLDKGADATRREEWLQILEAAANATAALKAASAEIARRQGWPPPPSPAETSRLLDLEVLVRRGPSLPPHWLTDLDIDGARIEAEFWKQATDAYRAGNDALRARFRPAFFELPDDVLHDFDAAVGRAQRLLDRKAEVLVERRAGLGDWLGVTLKELHEWQRLAGRLASALRLRAFRGSMDGALRITRVALLLNRSERPLWNWLDQNACVKVDAALREMEAFYARYKAARRTLLAAFHESAASLDAEALIARFEGPWQSRLRWLHPGYHRDRRLLRAHRHDGRCPEDPLGELRKIKAFKLQQSMLDPQRKKYQALLGPYDEGPDASMAPARRALATARNLLALVTDGAELEAFAEVLRDGAASAEVAALASTLETLLSQSRTLMTRIEAALPAGLVPGEEQPLMRLPFGRFGPWAESAKDAVEALLARYDAVAALRSASAEAPPLFEDVQDALVQLSDLRAFERRLAESAEHLRNVYGHLFTGPDSEWTAVLGALDRAEEVRSRFGPQGVPQAFLEIGPRDAAAAANPEGCRELVARCEALYARLQAGFDQAHASHRRPVDGRDAWDGIAASLRSLAERIDEREEWIEYAQVRRAFEAHDLWPLLHELQSRRLPAGMLVSAVRRSALEAWCDYQRAEAPALREFTRAGLDALEAEFRDLDRRHRQGAAARVVAEAEAARLSCGSDPVALLASPFAVITLPGEMAFDLVVFDEACRIAPEEAVFALSRAARAVVFGDPQQLPPSIERERAPNLLGELVAAGAPMKRLRWHYSSRHEPLIAFSNALFYGGQLATLPAPTAAGAASGIRLERVADGSEPERVAALVEEHLKRQSGSSLGVVTAGEASRGAIERAISRVLDRDPALRQSPKGDLLDGFFVKSIEDASGEARDRIILCLGSAVMADAALDAWQLNVAVTRARAELIVVTPLVPEDVDPAAASDKLQLLRRFLDHAARGGAAEPAPAVRSTPLREAVAAAARALGCGVVQPVGSGAYPVQIGVVHPERPDRFLLGVECDDDVERSGWPARDRERLRGEALEALGWTLHRIRSPEWVANREGEIERLREALQRADQGVRAEVLASVGKPPAAPAGQAAIAVGAGETVAYQPARLAAVTLPAAFHNPRNAATLAALLRDVVAAEAPVHRDLAAQRVLAACGIGRRGKRVDQALDGALRLARERGWLEGDGAFLRAPGGMPEARVRTPAAGDAATLRDGLHVPPEEIRLAAALVLRTTPGLAPKRLLTHVGRLFGIERLPARARAHFQRALPGPD